MKVIIGLIFIIGGFFYTKYHAKIAHALGMMGISSNIFGSGSEYTLHLIIGIAFIIIGILTTTGTFQDLLYVLFGRFFGSMGTV
jgi:hypothetical protein